MKPKKLFLVVLFIIILLTLWCIFISKRDNIFFHKEINSGYGVALYETIPIRKTLYEAQKEIDSILLQNPIKFVDNGTILESNKTVDDIVSILKVTVGDIAIRVSSYSDINGSSRFNRQLTQKRADNIASYIKDRYQAKFINSIGYGKEFPLSKEDNRTDNRVEIYLQRIYNDF